MATVSINREFKTKIEQLNELPTLPEIARQLLELQANPNADVRQLVSIIENDPVSTTQILKYANSAFFNSARKIESLLDAINLFGFDNALHCSLSLAAAKQFTIPLTGPIGMRAFWQHAIYSAHLMQILANKIPMQNGPKPGLAYLAGLVHNFGFLLLGHAFPDEFNRLNKTLSLSSTPDVLQEESTLLGIHHYQLGVWFMRKWGLPSEILTTVFEHHNDKYRGKHFEYANLALLADRALFANEIMGDVDYDELPPRILMALKIDHLVVQSAVNELFESRARLDGLIEALLAQ
ncbi:MAG: HDOD domain-containing protein [Gammaproteobacteria bacterium]|nr:HDOD domain-containing protein [Gammaproteobacteria bacterium]